MAKAIKCSVPMTIDVPLLRRQRNHLLALVAGDFDGSDLRSATEGSPLLRGAINVVEAAIDAALDQGPAR